uniref:Uncharacterized protein n=1 Tax=Setaria digitata TaxID=48799 RepID=A0A915PWI4_9BILA
MSKITKLATLSGREFRNGWLPRIPECLIAEKSAMTFGRRGSWDGWLSRITEWLLVNNSEMSGCQDIRND